MQINYRWLIEQSTPVLLPSQTYLRATAHVYPLRHVRGRLPRHPFAEIEVVRVTTKPWLISRPDISCVTLDTEGWDRTRHFLSLCECTTSILMV
jgi:hypothetical protein